MKTYRVMFMAEDGRKKDAAAEQPEAPKPERMPERPFLAISWMRRFLGLD